MLSLRSSRTRQLPRSQGAHWPASGGLWAAIWAAERSQPSRRAQFAAWAGRQALARRLIVLAAVGATVGAVVGALTAALPTPSLNVSQPAGSTIVWNAITVAAVGAAAGGLAGLTYATVVRALRAPSRMKRWGAGAAVGVAWALGATFPVWGTGVAAMPPLLWALVVAATVGIWLFVPPARALGSGADRDRDT